MLCVIICHLHIAFQEFDISQACKQLLLLYIFVLESKLHQEEGNGYW